MWRDLWDHHFAPNNTRVPIMAPTPTSAAAPMPIKLHRRLDLRRSAASRCAASLRIISAAISMKFFWRKKIYIYIYTCGFENADAEAEVSSIGRARSAKQLTTGQVADGRPNAYSRCLDIRHSLNDTSIYIYTRCQIGITCVGVGEWRSRTKRMIE